MNVLRKHREDKFLSINELAEKSGLSRGAILSLELDRVEGGPRPRTIRKLAEALGIEPSELRDLRKVPA
jgi:transcriptional regulator with XRE-family HTH domain